MSTKTICTIRGTITLKQLVKNILVAYEDMILDHVGNFNDQGTRVVTDSLQSILLALASKNWHGVEKDFETGQMMMYIGDEIYQAFEAAHRGDNEVSLEITWEENGVVQSYIISHPYLQW